MVKPSISNHERHHPVTNTAAGLNQVFFEMARGFNKSNEATNPLEL